MARFPRPWLPALAALALACPALAAPSPVATPAPFGHLDRYLPDDTDFVLLLNVKPVVTSPLFTKHLKKQVDTWLAHPLAKPWLKDLGVDPLKDVDRLIVANARSCYGDKPGSSEGPLVLIVGRFDPAKVHAALDKAARAGAGGVHAHKSGKEKIYEFKGSGPSGSGFAAVLDRNTFLVAQRKDQVVEALAKSAGKKKTALKYRAIPAALKTFKPDVAVQAVGLGEMALGVAPPPPAGMPAAATVHTLGEVGIKELRVTVRVKDDIKATVVLTAKADAEGKKLFQNITNGLNLIKPAIKVQADTNKEFAPFVKVVDSITSKTAGRTMTLEGVVTSEAIQGFIELAKKGM
jgi:hypothetical protein